MSRKGGLRRFDHGRLCIVSTRTRESIKIRTKSNQGGYRMEDLSATADTSHSIRGGHIDKKSAVSQHLSDSSLSKVVEKKDLA